MLEQLADGLPQRGGVFHRYAAGLLQPLVHARLGQVKHQIVGPQAGDVHVGVEAGQRVVEVVGQKHGFELRFAQHTARPIGLGHPLLGGIVQRFPILRRQPVVREAEERLGHFDEPTVLDRVLQRPHAGHQPADLFLGGKPRLFDLLLRHPGRVGQLGVVVIAQDVGQRRGSRLQRVDVRVRIDQDERIELVEQPLAKSLGHELRFLFQIIEQRRISCVAHRSSTWRR